MGHIDNYYPASGRVILHVDMNAFTVRYTKRRSRSFTGEAHSCRRRHRVAKRRHCYLLLCGTIPRDTHRNERETGARIYPDLMIIQPDFHLYRKYSNAFMNIAYAYTPPLEATSIDECYLDITGSKQFGTPGYRPRNSGAYSRGAVAALLRRHCSQ